jgi:hypothetical protein
MLLVTAVLLSGSPASMHAAKGGWAGISEAQAIAKARATLADLIEGVKSYDVPIGKPMNAAKVIHYVETVPPSATRARCNGRQVWKVAWPNSSPRIGYANQLGWPHVPTMVVSKGKGTDTASICRKTER